MQARLLWLALSMSLTASSVNADDGAVLYQRHCSVCHGERGDGASHARAGLVPPPRNFTDRQYAAHATTDSIAAAIRNGKPGTAMVAWGRRLNDAQIRELAEFVHMQFVRKADSDSLGARVYARNCSVCHGENGGGAQWGRQSLQPPPRDFTTADPGRLTRARMLDAVTAGRPGTAMTSFATRLDEQAMAAVVDYIRAAYMRALPTAGKRASAMSTVGIALIEGSEELAASAARRHANHTHESGADHRLNGDAARGAERYRDNCVPCHGSRGDGNGPRAYFIFPRPRNFLESASRRAFDRAALVTAISHGVAGREMPAWNMVLDEQAIADIAEYVYTTFIHRNTRHRHTADEASREHLHADSE